MKSKVVESLKFGLLVGVLLAIFFGLGMATMYFLQLLYSITGELIIPIWPSILIIFFPCVYSVLYTIVEEKKKKNLIHNTMQVEQALKFKLALDEAQFSSCDNYRNSGLFVKSILERDEQISIIIRNAECNDNDRYAFVTGVSLWDISELNEVEGLYYINKDQYSSFNVQDRLHTDNHQHSNVILKYKENLLSFIGLTHLYNSKVIMKDDTPIGLYFEFVKC